MSKSIYMIFGIISVIALAVALIISFAMGGCETQIETATGGSVPMKCHWTFVAIGLTSIVGIVGSICSIVAKDALGRRLLAAVTIVAAVICLMLTTSSGIGLCMNEEMHCHTTALYVRIALAVGIVTSIVQIATAQPKKLPKRTL